MNGNPSSRPSRRSPRKPGYDYATPGAYFVTLCTFQRKHCFGEIQDSTVTLSNIGRIADHYWRQLPSYFDHIVLDEWIVMPNHLHAIIWLQFDPEFNFDADATGRIELDSSRGNSSTYVSPGSLSAIIGTYKSLVTRRVNRMMHTPGSTIWQGRYYDNIVRNEEALHCIRRYIVENPKRWTLDVHNAERSKSDNLAKSIWLMLQDEA